MQTIKNKRIFITGGAGFIASYLCESLIEHNRVVVYDNKSRDSLKYTSIVGHRNLEVIEGDILDIPLLRKSMLGSHIVIHCAAIAGIYTVVKSPTATLKVNFLGTFNTLEVAIENKVEKFIDFSTSEVYGPYVYKGTEDDLTSQGPVGEARWTYAVSKLAAEHLTHSFYKEYNLPISTVRPFNVYGPRQVGEGAIRGMILKAIKDEPMVLYNDGTQIRAWCFIEDFVRGVLTILSEPRAVGQTFNLGNPQGAITNFKLAKMIKRLANSKSEFIFKKHPGPEVEVRVPSIKRAQELLGYVSQVGLEEGISKTIEWYRNSVV